MINVWISFRDDFDWPGDDPDQDNGAQRVNRAFLQECYDWQTIGGIYKKESAQGRTWTLVSGYWPTVQEYIDAFATLQGSEPGKQRELAAWDVSGVKIREPHYPNLISYMPGIWNGDEPPTFSPATELTDVNFLAGYENPRDFS